MPQNNPQDPGQLGQIPSSNYDVHKDLGRVIDRTKVVDAPSAPNLLFGDGAPYTGDGKSKINPAYAAYIGVLKSTPVNPLQQPYYTNLSKAERYSNDSVGGFHPFDTNIENWYGENQSWFDQWGNRIGKFGVKALGSFANALMDIPNMINAASEGNVDKMWDNPVNTWASDMMEWSEKTMPNYKTNWEREHPFLNLIPIYGNSGNGWGNVFEQVGFTVGAIGGAVVEDLAVGALTGGVGEVPLAAMQINKAVYNLGKLINAGEDTLGALRQTIKNSDDIVKGLRGVDAFNFAVRKGLWGANMITSGFSEAAFEGIESYKTLSTDLKQQFLEENGRLPSYEESQEIERTTRKAGTSRFLLNSALLAVTNTIQWGNLLRPLNATKDIIEAEAKSGIRVALKEGSKDVFEAITPTSKFTRWGNAIANSKVGSTLIGSSSEGFEEGAQFVIQNGVNDYYKRQYNGDAISTTNNFMKSFSLGLSKTLGTQEGWENIVYGLLGGAMYKGGEHIGYAAKGINKPNHKAEVDAVVRGLNSQSLTGIFENKYAENVAATSIQADLQKAAQSGNTFLYKNYKHEQFVNFVISGLKQNKFDTRLAQLQELKKLDDAEFAKTFGIPATTEGRKAVTEYVNKLEEDAKYIKEVSKKVGRTFINPFKYKGTGSYKNKEAAAEQAKENEKYLAFEGAKEQLTYSMSISRDSERRAQALEGHISNTMSMMSPELAVKLASAEGMKTLKSEYKKRADELESGLKIAKDPQAEKEAKWYAQRVAQIEHVLATNDGKAYNELLQEVFDKAKQDGNAFFAKYGGEEDKSPTAKVAINRVMDFATDIYLLNKRNKIAVDNYSALTTKGGFEKLYNKILDIRKEVSEAPVTLAPETPKAQNPQAEAALNEAQAAMGMTPTSVSNLQGSETTTVDPLKDEDMMRLNKVLVDIVDGKYIAQELELDFLGFQSIDDLKFSDPTVDMTKYTKVKSVSGKNFYIATATVNQARINVAKSTAKEVTEFDREAESSAPTNIVPPNDAKLGSEPLRVDDWLSKIFVPGDLKPAFNNAIFSGTPEEVKKDISITIRPLSPEFKALYDAQQAAQSYTPIKDFPGVFVSKAPIDLSVAHKGVEIGKVAFPERLLFKVGNQFLTIDKITPQQYTNLTGRSAAQHQVDVEDFKRQVAFKNYLAIRYKNNNFEPVTLTPEEISNLFNIAITYGEFELVGRDSDRGVYSELKRNTVTLPGEKGAIQTMAILSVPKRFVADAGERIRTDFVNTIYNQAFYDNGGNDDVIRSLIDGNLDLLHKINSRYIGVIQLPDGGYSFVALRPSQMGQEEKNSLFSRLVERARLSNETNFVQSTKEEASGVVLFGDQEIYYKLPSDASRKFNDEFNNQINSELFISDNAGKSFFTMTVSPIGALRLEVFEPVSAYKTTLYLSPQKVAGLNGFQDLVDAFSKEIEKKNISDPAFAALKIKLNDSNFRQASDDDAAITADALAPRLTASTTTEVFKNGTMRLEPKTGEVNKAFQDQKAPAPQSEVPSDIEAKIADVERRRQKEIIDAGLAVDLRGIISERLIKEGIGQEKRISLIGTQDSPIISSASREDINNLISTYQKSKENQLAEFNAKGEGFNPETGNLVTDDTSWWDDKINKIEEINAKYDAELAALETPEAKAVEEAISPEVAQPNIFDGTVPLDEKGQPTQPIDFTPDTTINQEAIGDVEYPSAKEALASADIAYRETPEGLEFYTISTGEVLPALRGVAPIDLAKDMGFKIAPPQRPKSDEEFDFRRSDVGNTEITKLIDFNDAQAYIESILPSWIAVEDMEVVFDQLREQGIGNPERDVWGAFQDGVIYLNKNAKDIGVQYHEAFHAVFSLIGNEEERNRLLAYANEQQYLELRKKGSSIRQEIAAARADGLWNNLSNAEAVDKMAEEWLAEKFRTWKNNKKDAGILQKIFNFIEKLFKWFLRSGNEMEALFNKIDTGGFKYTKHDGRAFFMEGAEEDKTSDMKFMLVPARPGSLQVGKGQVTVKRNLDAKTSKQVVQSVAAYFNNYKNNVGYINFSDDALLEIVLDDLKALYSPNNPLYAGRTEEEKTRIANSDQSYIYANEESREAIKDAAKVYINSIKYIEQFEEEDLELEPEQEYGNDQPATGFDNRAENRGGFSSLPSLLREYIGFTSYEKTDEFGNKNLLNGFPILATVDSLSVYYGLLRSLANITDPIKFFQKMIAFTNGNEQSRHFVSKFIYDSGLDVDVLMTEGKLVATKNKALVELVRKGFNKYRVDYVFTEHDSKKLISKSYQANRRNVENVQFDKWANTFISEYASHDEERQKYTRQRINDIRNKYFDERRVIKYDGQRLSEVANEIRYALNGVGIQLSEDFIKYSLLNINAKKFDTENEGYKKQGAELQFEDPQNKFITKQDYQYVQIMKIADETTLTREFLDELAKSLAADNNPYFKDIIVRDGVEEELDTAMVNRFLNLGRGNALFDESVGESSYTNMENKVVYAHQDGTFNVKFSYKLKDAAYRKQLRETGVREEITAYRDLYDQEWLTKNFLLNSTEFETIADNLLFQRIDGMRAVETNAFGKIITQEFREQKEGVTYGSYSPREFMVNFTNFYVSYAKSQRTSKGTIATSPHMIRVLEASKTADTVNLPINLDIYRNNTVTEKGVNIISEEVAKEFRRIARVQTEIGTLKENIVENYHTGAFADDGFTITKGYRGLQFTDNITSVIKKSTAKALEVKARNGESLTKEDEAQIKADIAESLNKMVDDTLDIMVREGIIRKNPDSYGNILLHLDFWRGNPELNLVANKFKDNMGHVIINDYINTFAYNQILHGDSALGLKNDGGIDAVKRAKGDNAAIVPIRTDLIDPSLGITDVFTHSTVAIFKEPVAEGTKIADAQMYTTVKGLRYTLWGLGRLTPRLAKVLDALEKGDDIHNLLNDITGRRYDGVFDRDAGILRWDEMTNSIKLVYKDGKTYFKMSVVVLQPDLTSYKDKDGNWKPRPGWTTLHNLRTKMEADGVHFAAPESASKMMTLDVSRSKDFSDLKGHLFSNDFFGLQTENPSNKLEITTPTQLLQLIDSEQDDDVVAHFDGKDMKVGEIKAAYQSYVAQKVNNAYSIAKNDVYDIQDFNTDIEESIAQGKVTPRLAKFQARALETLEASGADAQLLDFFSLDENGNPKYNLNLMATKTKFQQLYLAYFSRGVMSQKNPGYTVALMSGIDTKTLRRAKRIKDGKVIEWEHVRRELWDTNYNGIQRETIYNSIEDVTEEGQYFIDELCYNVPEYDADGNITGYYSEMMLPAHYREFLEIPRDEPLPDAITKMFGVRIPSQDKHSFMSLKLVDFLPANLGSTGMFPKELIALSGADFDIDKEFISRYDFYMYKNERGVTQFRKYGDAKSIEGRWEEYKQWMTKNSKSIKAIVKDLATNDKDYQAFIKKDIVATDILSEVFDLNITQKLKRKYFDTFASTALKQLGLPSTLEEFAEASKTRELNNGVLTNKIVDAYIALLTNKGMQDIAKTPATLTALEKIKDEDDIQLKDADGNVIDSVFSKNINVPVDSLIGKYYAFRNNTTGKNNIGIDVNANLIYSVLNKGDVRLMEGHKGFEFDGQVFDSFAGNHEYNLSTGKFDGRRTNDILSTLITSATDEAKEQLNALYGLSVDALKIVNYLVALKTPLKTAIYFVNQPAIRNYLSIKGVRQNTLQTTNEEKMFRGDFKDAAIARTHAETKGFDKISDEDLYKLFEKEGKVEEDC